jgi:MYXO-CTERM domain-containing protein
MHHPNHRIVCLILGLLLTPALVVAQVVNLTPDDDLVSALRQLNAGDEVVLGGGTYNLQSRFEISGQGREDAPIIIRAAEGEIPIITRPDARQNTINIQDSAYLELVGIEVTGGSHGIRIGNSNFITLRNLHIHHTGEVGVSANFRGESYQGMHFVGNHIHHAGGHGEAFYLGCNDAECAFFDSVIEGNYIHDLIDGTAQGDGIELKYGCYGNIVRDNVIHGTRYPCIIVYGAPNNVQNIIEGNVMWDCGDHGIQVAADTRIVNNIILGAAQDGIYSRQHQGGVPGNIEILHNTVINNRNAIRIAGIVGPITVANNALYSANQNAIRVEGDTAQLTATGNVGQGGLQGISEGFDDSGDRNTDFADLGGQDVFPAADSALIGAADAEYVVAMDFNGVDREGTLDVGAYVFDAEGNPGWEIGPEFKPMTPDNPMEPDDAGVPQDSGTIDDAGVPEDGGQEPPDLGVNGDMDPPLNGDAGYTPTCETGETQACVCTTGQNGAQSCRGDLTGWQECVCAEPAPANSGGCSVSLTGAEPAGLLLGLLLLIGLRRRH